MGGATSGSRAGTDAGAGEKDDRTDRWAVKGREVPEGGVN